ncbi:heat shock cognate 71 kDa protein-like isoform X2 [Melanotaenia boesemani]|uniref:heat shock cognate 71 kDa protein-like isoform X2 n=1 Tax=Melanotaenia boesemani TaxID=1250792 RepID=UPI001C0510EB|nr:heat shock cognate 71 kDa protein-like isoform X2 [Melanotaenia boesemani]
MSSVQHLREFISERLTAAAEEIFTEFEKTIVQYEEEIDRQRRLLDITWNPQIKLIRTAAQQHRENGSRRSSPLPRKPSLPSAFLDELYTSRCLKKARDMVQEAEKYKAEDDVQRDKMSAKNGLESYAFNMKSTVEDEKLAGKISDDDKQKILEKCNEVISWLDKNQTAERDEYEHQQKELEKVCNPIITKLYQSAGGMPGGMPEGMPGGFPGAGGAAPGGGSSGPTIEEVD